jgi:hypothetical protein
MLNSYLPMPVAHAGAVSWLRKSVIVLTSVILDTVVAVILTCSPVALCLHRK